MRARSKWLIAFLLLTAFTVYTYRYSIIGVETTANTIQVLFGSRITISFHRLVNTTNNLDTASKNKLPAHAQEVNILLWSKALRNKDEKQIFPSYGKAQHPCPVKYQFVSDKRLLNSVSAVIIHAGEASNLPPEMKHVPWMLFYDQPPIAYKRLGNETFMQKFNYSIGYRLDSDFPNPLISEPANSKPLGFHQKFDYIAAVFSNCTKLRTDYVRELSRYSRVKSYGECLRNVEKNNIARKEDNNFITSKKRLLKLHKFALSLMKFDCHDYVDDTLNHAWEAGSLPVFLGTDNLRDILPGYLKRSFLPISQFSNPQHLAERIQELVNNKADYESFMSWKTKRNIQIDASPLWNIWRPMYTPGCRIAMTVANSKSQGSLEPKRILTPLTCNQRDTNLWLGKKSVISKITDD